MSIGNNVIIWGTFVPDKPVILLVDGRSRRLRDIFSKRFAEFANEHFIHGAEVYDSENSFDYPMFPTNFMIINDPGNHRLYTSFFDDTYFHVKTVRVGDRETHNKKKDFNFRIYEKDFENLDTIIERIILEILSI